MTLTPRAVIVHRRTEREEVVGQYGTPQQAAFVAGRRGRSLQAVEARYEAQTSAIQKVASTIPSGWRRGEVERSDLDRFVFGPEDVIVVVGQDGLVANVAKYLKGQVVIGVNTNPKRNPGVLVTHPPTPAELTRLLRLAVSPEVGTYIEARPMVEALTDDGQSLRALNEIYVGHPSHQSARYRIEDPSRGSENQSSSGVLVGTGTGSTGWCQSVWRERHSQMRLPDPIEARLCWFVREAWPSPATGTDYTEGELGPDDSLTVVAESDLVVFGDGIESDALSLTWGQSIIIGLARQRLHLLA